MANNTRFLLLLALGFCFLTTAVVKASKDDDDGCDAQCWIDIINVIVFVFAGGPDEIVPRLIALVVAVVLITVVWGILSCLCDCCGVDADDCARRFHRSDCGKATGWALTGVNTYNNTRDLRDNWHKYW